MLLKSIEFNDFRPFIGHQKINFECKDEKNVIVVLGNNTHGKSTLILSFLWCFYGDSNFLRPLDILNQTVESQMNPNEKRKASVIVELEHENIEYTIKREQAFIKGYNGQLSSTGDTTFKMTYVDEHGETKSCGSTKKELLEAMNAIIPRDLMPYFFFEGEKDNNLSTKAVGKAVKSLLGLDTLSKTRVHLRGETKGVSTKSVMGIFEAMQNENDNTRADSEYQKKINAENKLQEIETRKSEIEIQIENYESKIDEINQILRNNAPTRELQKRRDSVANDISDEQNELKQSVTRYIKDFNSQSLSLLSIPFFEKVKYKLSQMDLDDKAGIKGIEGPAIMELLKRGECLCGTELKEGSLAYKTIEKYINILPPVNISQSIRDMFDLIAKFEEDGTNYIQDFRQDYKNVQYSLNKINTLEREEASLLSELSKITIINDKQYEEDLRTYKQRLANLRNEKDQCIAQIATLNQTITTATNNYNMYKSKSDKNKENQLYYDYAEAIYNWVDESYSKKEVALRERLNIAVTELFNNMYSGKREVEIDSNYNMVVKVEGKPLALTGGLNIIQYFSFVGGLVKLAREVMSERNGETEIYGEEYPLVLDAAFSHADENHVETISKQLSTVTNQLVFAVMKKDWNYVEDGIKDKICRVYNLNKINEKEIIIEEVE